MGFFPKFCLNCWPRRFITAINNYNYSRDSSPAFGLNEAAYKFQVAHRPLTPAIPGFRRPESDTILGVDWGQMRPLPRPHFGFPFILHARYP